MAKLDEQRNSSRAKAEALLTRKKQQETERVANVLKREPGHAVQHDEANRMISKRENRVVLLGQRHVVDHRISEWV